MNAHTPSSVRDALCWASMRLRAVGVETPTLDAELLLSHLLGWDRAALWARGEHLLASEQRQRYAALVERRLAHEPVAYLTGRRAFYDVDLAVDPRVLIPRPETEHLVESALSWAHVHDQPGLRIADVGTGSGAIALVLARHLPEARVWAVDVSAGALEVARANLTRYGLAQRVQLVHGDLLTCLAGPLDLIAANLPYVLSAELPTLAPDVRQYEPALALDGGADGLDLLARLIPQAAARLASPGLLVVEIDPRQAQHVVALAIQALPEAHIRVLTDYAGWERVVSVERPALHPQE